MNRTEERRCYLCRWHTKGMSGPECRYFDRDRDRAEFPETAERCPFFEDRARAGQVAAICKGLARLAEAVECIALQISETPGRDDSAECDRTPAPLGAMLTAVCAALDEGELTLSGLTTDGRGGTRRAL